jgi:hypothetical protein
LGYSIRINAGGRVEDDAVRHFLKNPIDHTDVQVQTSHGRRGKACERRREARWFSADVVWELAYRWKKKSAWTAWWW